MRHADRVTPIAAVASALAALTCCLPVTFAAAAATASLGALAARYRPWLIGLSVALLVLGFVQMSRTARRCGRRSIGTSIVFWTSAAVVTLVVVFPQLVAAVIADWLP